MGLSFADLPMRRSPVLLRWTMQWGGNTWPFFVRCQLICDTIELFHRKLLSQSENGQTYGRSSLCKRPWIFRLCARLNVFPQIVQTCLGRWFTTGDCCRGGVDDGVIPCRTVALLWFPSSWPLVLMTLAPVLICFFWRES